jgi:hypothetical protein
MTATGTETRACRHCGEPIIPDRLFGWVHAGESGAHHFCATNKVNEYAQPAEEAGAR